MKRISLAFTLLFLGSLSLAAADAPAVAALPIFQAPGGTCSALGQNALMKKPMYLSTTFLQPPCIATTSCSNGSTITCPTTSYSSGCLWKDGCWAQCEDGSFLWCPGARRDPACAIE